jgi:hypothetical protein
MKVKLHAWLMWDAVQYNDINFHEDRQVLGCVWFGFWLWLLSPKAKSQTKGLDLGSSFF